VAKQAAHRMYPKSNSILSLGARELRLTTDPVVISPGPVLRLVREPFDLALIGLASVVMISGSAGPARAAVPTPVVDQQIIVPNQAAIAVTAGWSYGQSFTVGRGGALTRIDFQLGRAAGTTQPLQVALRTANGDLPNLDPAALLFGGTISAADVPVLTYSSSFTASMDLSSAAPVIVTPGEKLVVVLSSTDPNWYNWDNSGYFNNNPYPNGTAVQSTPSSSGWAPMANWDFGFRTWVTPVPEPSGLLPFGILVLFLGRWLTKR
jgi:hypothetical protein